MCFFDPQVVEINGLLCPELMTDVQERHDQIRQLEVSMLELHQVFLVLQGNHVRSTLCLISNGRQQVLYRVIVWV